MILFLVTMVVLMAFGTIVAERRRKADMSAVREALKMIEEVKKDA